MWLYISDYGRRFIWECLKQYFQENVILVALFIIYIGLVIFLLIKGSKKEKYIFVYPSIFFLLTVFNPFVADKFIEVFNVSIRFYRYFWLLPIPILLVYMLIKIMDKCNKYVRIGIGVALFACCILGYGYTNGVKELPSNIYKMNQDVLQASTIISGDREKEDVVALYDYWFYYDLRSYDASICPFITTNQFSELMGMTVTEESLREAEADADYQSLIKYVYASGQGANPEILKTAIAESDIDYIILHQSAESAYNQFLAAGCEVVGSTDQFNVLRCYSITE